ncbi:type IV inositol polyphosphate 5-phosphatase 9-like [Zingiber officinale]|uniref:type IV inositol polyphosphate 5-phosphatase 9-like n=1 Tax=Zingiber officinale TaxID=94328 RepID=UPI001C4AE983|nr:type IV inositol polyphosphate 5-phosphatase 9-like [Zingiber officinale]
MEGSSSISLKRTYRLFVSTWNVGGLLPSDDAELEEWLDIKNGHYDIYILGFQEVVPLNARNVLGPKNRRVLERWSSLIRKSLNKLPSSKLHEGKQKVHPMKEEEEEEKEGGHAQEFECVASKQMVGILVSVWARSDLRRCISHRSIACVGCGVMGCLGNKGSVSIRFLLHETSFCFACCHFASGGKEGDEVKRNTNAMEILSRTTFPSSPPPPLDLPQKITDHDRVFLFGDLNYRISLPNASTRSLMEQNRWSILLQKDQLRMEFSKGKLFEDWQEGAITFFPTYKYYLNSDKYYGCVPTQKSGKSRAPAWCDRILWRGEGINQERYDRCELRLSDHRPVRGIFAVDVDVPKSSS